MRAQCLEALRTQRMPTNRNEEYRFTDLTPLLRLKLQAAVLSQQPPEEALSGHRIEGASRLVVVDGVLDQALSDTAVLPAEVYCGGLQGAPAEVAATRGGPFGVLNGALARDVVVVVVPAGTDVLQPLHILFLSTGRLLGQTQGGVTPASSPRLLVHLGSSASLELIEEHAGSSSAASATYFTNSVLEAELGENAALRHGYAQLDAAAAYHMKATLVTQGLNSSYILTEACLGAAIARHDISINQDNGGTSTVMRSFVLCGDRQLHDVHSKLRLSHPSGNAVQLHKCIVSASTGRGVFDGNVKVEQLAQKTDAQQLSRSLLLVPRATVNVKPNLQIIADDVKCTHGCAISDLPEKELFYFRARGIDPDAARQVLVYSFGNEVTQHFKHKQLMSRIQSAINTTLAKAPVALSGATE
eukprot:jgi/Astpho2/977/e_gw1.00016.340.1_t